MIFIVSTFLKDCDEITNLKENIFARLSPHEFFWLVSSKSSAVAKRLSGHSNVYVIVKEDSSYAEGWNNALSLLDPSAFSMVGHVIFLGEGDRINNILIPSSSNNNEVCCGVTIRHSLNRSYTFKKRSVVIPSFFWFRIGAWTPSCMFPVSIFSEFKFPTMKVGADIELFIYAYFSSYKFISYSGYEVDMSDGGLSSDLTCGEADYVKILERYSYSPVLIFLGKVLRWLNISLRYR